MLYFWLTDVADRRLESGSIPLWISAIGSHIPDLDAGRDCGGLTSLATTNGDARGVVAVAARVGDIVEQDNFGRLDNDIRICTT